MKPQHVLVFGGTSEALAICQLLAAYHIDYSLSVATKTGWQAAQAFAPSIAKRTFIGRLGVSAMRERITQLGVDWVIDAGHPYAQELRHTIMVACMPIDCPVVRFERSSAIALCDHPLVRKVSSSEAACAAVTPNQQRVLLTTGSKDLAFYCRQLAGKTLFARVLPSSQVLAECEALGLGLEQIIAIKGPFSEVMNHAIYQSVKPDVVITKESGSRGGFAEKVLPCIALGIACVVIERPSHSLTAHYRAMMSSIEECHALFAHWQAKEQIA